MRKTARSMAAIVGMAALTWAPLALAGEGQHKHGSSGAQVGQAQTTAPETYERSMLHGGKVTMTKQHYFETVFAPDGVRVYIYTDAQAPMMAEGATGTVTLTFKGETKKKSAPFDIETPLKDEKAVYFCPMHAEVVQMEPGICKKCGGMKLFQQDRLFAKADLSKTVPGEVDALITISGLDDPEPAVTFTETNGKPTPPPAESKPEGTPTQAKKKVETTE